MPIPESTDPNARAECPECYALVRVARWRDHAEWHRALHDDLAAPAPEPEVVDWPADPEPAAPVGPYRAGGDL